MARMPLQSGASAARLLSVGFAKALGGALVCCWLLAVGWEMLARDDMPSLVDVIGGLVPLAFVCFGVADIRMGRRARPSDVVLSADGVTIEGGPHHGRRWPLAALGPGTLKLATTMTKGEKPTTTTTTITVGGDPTPLAIAIDPSEAASLADLTATLHDLATAGREAPPVNEGVLRCAGCGSPVVPVAQRQATCGACGRETAIPGPLRERIDAAELLQRERPRVERMTRRLLDQPGAHAANLAISALAASLPLSVALAGVAFAYQTYTADSVRMGTILGLLELPFVVALAAYLLVRLPIVDRVALGSLTLDLAARRDRDGTQVCHACGGPLLAGHERAAARCVYCGADNVLGVELGLRATAHARQSQSLERVLGERRRQRLRCGLGGVVGVLIAWHAVASLVQGFEHNRTTDPTEIALRGRDRGEFGRASHSAAAPLHDRQIVLIEAPPVDASDGAPRLRLVDETGPSPHEAGVVIEAAGLRDPAWIGGEHVLYIADVDGRAALRRVAVADGTTSELHVADDLESPSASADGKRIAFAESSQGVWYVTVLEDGAVRRLVPGRRPKLHPFVARVVFIGEQDGRPKPFTLDLTAGAAPIPVFEPNRWRYDDPVYSPCGGWIALVSNAGWDQLRTGSELETHNLVAIEPGTSEPIQQLTWGNASVRRPSWTGQTIYFDTDGHPGGQRRVYPVGFGGPMVGELHSPACKERLAAAGAPR